MKKYSITYFHLLALALAACFMTSLVSLRAKAITPNPLPKDRVVMIEDNKGACTGVIVETNRVLTCAHCVDLNLKQTVNSNLAKTLKIDRETDLALLEVQTPAFERISLKNCNPSDEVYTWGHPMGEKTLFFSKGYIMNVQDKIILSSIITVPGDSGSPLFSQDGCLLGIIDGAISANGTDFPIATTIPASTVRIFLQ